MDFEPFFSSLSACFNAEPYHLISVRSFLSNFFASKVSSSIFLLLPISMLFLFPTTACCRFSYSGFQVGLRVLKISTCFIGTLILTVDPVSPFIWLLVSLPYLILFTLRLVSQSRLLLFFWLLWFFHITHLRDQCWKCAIMNYEG